MGLIADFVSRPVRRRKACLVSSWHFSVYPRYCVPRSSCKPTLPHALHPLLLFLNIVGTRHNLVYQQQQQQSHNPLWIDTTQTPLLRFLSSQNVAHLKLAPLRFALLFSHTSDLLLLPPKPASPALLALLLAVLLCSSCDGVQMGKLPPPLL